jgi:hypothetical protein
VVQEPGRAAVPREHAARDGAAERTRVSFGVAGDRDLRIVKASEGLYHPALLDKLRANGETIEDGLPEQELVRRFDAFGKRDAVLPPKVAALRKGDAAVPAAPAKAPVPSPDKRDE